MRPIDERILNPCPICGCSVRVWAKGSDEGTEYVIECDNNYCGLTYGGSCGYDYDSIKEAWNSVTASPTTEKTGRWIAERYCSECEWDKHEAELVCNIPTNYCPNCGAKMKGEK